MSADLEHLVEAKGLTKRFGAFVAVDGIEFAIRRGEAFGFLGPNGAGKTSTMRMIACMSPRTAGDLTVRGMDPERNGPEIRAGIGLSEEADAAVVAVSDRPRIRSATGELTWDYGRERVLVATPKTQAIIGRPGADPIRLPGVTAQVTTGFVSLIFTPLDAFTDSHLFRERGIASYGFSPFAVTAGDARRIHGNDERIPVKSFQAGVRLMYQVVYDFCRR